MSKIIISQKVADALKENKPIVALETTIISHGMPYPKNVEIALEVERIIEELGAVPATIGIVDGKAIIGLSKEQIQEFGTRKGILKVSRRDLPYVLSSNKWGATTVAGTMILANYAGIEVFVTGGIGGVHRHGNVTFDISNDLDELGKTDVTVVCAGAKAILDLPLTLEYLETKGVPVIGYNSDNLAAFYSSDSGIPLEYNLNLEEISSFIQTKRQLNLKGGVLISNPIPKEYELPNNEINQYIELALKKANDNNITGKRVTPFLLSSITDLTNARSLEANIHLIKNNALVGAQLAILLKKVI
jgi:pseudouridine-5'-phosphate glycosidase